MGQKNSRKKEQTNVPTQLPRTKNESVAHGTVVLPTQQQEMAHSYELPDNYNGWIAARGELDGAMVDQPVALSMHKHKTSLECQGIDRQMIDQTALDHQPTHKHKTSLGHQDIDRHMSDRTAKHHQSTHKSSLGHQDLDRRVSDRTAKYRQPVTLPTFKHKTPLGHLDLDRRMRYRTAKHRQPVALPRQKHKNIDEWMSDRKAMLDQPVPVSSATDDVPFPGQDQLLMPQHVQGMTGTSELQDNLPVSSAADDVPFPGQDQLLMPQHVQGMTRTSELQDNLPVPSATDDVPFPGQDQLSIPQHVHGMTRTSDLQNNIHISSATDNVPFPGKDQLSISQHVQGMAITSELQNNLAVPSAIDDVPFPGQDQLSMSQHVVGMTRTSELQENLPVPSATDDVLFPGQDQLLMTQHVLGITRTSEVQDNYSVPPATDDVPFPGQDQLSMPQHVQGMTRTSESSVTVPTDELPVQTVQMCYVGITLPAAIDWQTCYDDLKYTLKYLKFKIQEPKSSNTQQKDTYVISFKNERQAMKAIGILISKRKIKAYLMEDFIEECIGKILDEKEEVLSVHQANCEQVVQSMTILEGKKQGNKKKGKTFRSIPEFEKIEVLKQKVLELNGQSTEFAMLTEEVIARLNSLMSGHDVAASLTAEINERFQREKERLRKALPIYAKKSVITKAVLNNQVCIIVGETGSGKSTQVVQYLYDAGFAEKGTIVCTQPRKVAAFSLEKYVSEEMKGCGHLVGCSVGARRQMSRTKILFTTDYALLLECIKDRDLRRFSCVIVDEAHERNINTDLLLGIIKKALPRRPDLRVIITSATIDPELFKQYFGDCPVLRVSGKMFPVDVIWKRKQEDPMISSSSDYVTEAVDKVVEIHKSNEEGDVLVFLTCAAEIDRACDKLGGRIRNDEITCLPLHGKLQQDDQAKVFLSTLQGKRKVVFSTNCAETSLTIPGIKFVVDTGRAKEMKYDQKRNLNSLEVSVISQSSANQRKGRAGRTDSGKCFRLYTEEIFDEMETSSKPEILRVHLGQALLKLMELGIENPADFDYVESPPPDSIKAAMTELVDLEATRNGHLTELGKKMAKLPVEPRLGKFLFEGIDRDVGYEALVLISVATVNGNVFFRMGTDEEKKKADQKKIEFCHLGGDFMTLLDVFRSWSEVDKRDRSKYCAAKSLNAKAMRMANDTLHDLKLTLNHELKIQKIDWSSFDRDQTDRVLQKTLFSCFLAKLCVYSGHEKAGYVTILGGHHVSIHPSSAIKSMGTYPQFIVYEKILKTSQDYILNVTPIEESWLRESIEDGKVELDIEALIDEHVVVCVPIRCSWTLIQKALMPLRDKMPALEKMVSSLCGDTRTVIEAKKSSGNLEVFILPKHADKAREVVQTYLEVERDKMRKETSELPMADAPLRLVVEKGFAVRQVLMPGMYRVVIIKNLPASIPKLDLLQFLTQFGNVIDMNYDNKSRLTFVTYDKPEEAEAAVSHSGEDIKIEPKRPRRQSAQNRGPTNHNFEVKITWLRRQPKGMANVSFRPRDDCYAHSAFVSLRSLEVHAQTVAVSVDKHRDNSLFMRRVPLSATKMDIKAALDKVLPGNKIDERDINIQYSQRGAINVSAQTQKNLLEDLINDYATPGSFDVLITNPTSDKYPFGHATVGFLSPNEGIEVARRLDGRKCHNGLESWSVRLEVKPFLNFFDTCLKRVYDLVKAEIKSNIDEIAEECFNECGKSLVLREKPASSKGRIQLCVETKCLDHYLVASQAVTKNIQCERIDCATHPQQVHFLFGESGKDQLKDIERNSGAMIYPDQRMLVLNVYGSSQQKENAVDALYRVIQDIILSGSSVWEFNLKEPGRPRGLLKDMMSKYGSDLQGLCAMDGVSKASVSVFKHTIQMYCTSEAREDILQIIDRLSLTWTSLSQTMDKVENDEEACPVCYCAVERPYRLATCGHAYCMSCLKEQLKAAQFPMTCAHENCSEMFTQNDMRYLENSDEELLDVTIKNALESYVNSNQDKVHHCPSPDCPMVYLVTTTSKAFRCNICSAATCTSCHGPYHIGLTCKEHEIDKEDPGRILFEQWMDANSSNRKRCPSCTSPIEKDGGCSYVQCSKCNASICWLCLKTFSNSAGVYEHQSTCARNQGNY